MKTGILVLLFCSIFQNTPLSQDSEIVKFLPLKTGNIWIYNWTSNSWPNNGSVRLKITGTTFSNGHIYYNFEQTGNPCTCAQQTYSPFLEQLNNPFRIDSSSGNIFVKSTDCGWHIGETLFDSLKLKPNITVSTSCFFVSCYDTNAISVFGNTYPSRYVGQAITTYGKFRRYVRGFGLVTSHQNGSYGAACDYSLAGCVLNGVVYGDTTYVGLHPVSKEISSEYVLYQNYPNPFNPVTTIKFQIPATPLSEGEGQRTYGAGVRLIVYDVLGREIATLVNEQLLPGTYEAEWDGTNYPSGVYIYKLVVSNEYSASRKMVLLK